MAWLPSFPVDADQPLVVEMARESLRVRARQSVQSRTTVMVAAVIAMVAFGAIVPAWRLAGWALPVVLLAQLNAMLCARVLRELDQASAAQLAREQTLLWWMTLANQVAMGLTVWWIGYANTGAAATIATTLQLIYLGGALVNASTHPPTFIAGAWINLLLAASFWLTQTQLGWPLAFALAMMGLIMSRSCRQSAAAFEESLRMRFENADLVKRLAHEKNAAEEANAAKSRFLAAASHDLRQPLHALLVFSTLLHKTQTPQTAELVTHIRSAASSLDKLFAGLLDLSKLETGGVVPQLQAVHVNGIAQELCAEYEEACRHKGIGIACSGASQWVLSDPFLLERVLRNLIDNAVKYTRAGGVTVEISQGPSQAIVEVRDTGEGIAPELQPRIFEEYFQVGNRSRDLAKGSGLGLAIVKRLCALLDARIGLQSQPGAGSCFRLELQSAPILDAAGGAAAPTEDDPMAQQAPLQGLVIWLVEDNELVQIATRRALEDLGCAVHAWSAMPRDTASAPSPDALVADYRLDGDTTGLQVARELRRTWPQLPVAIVTGDPAIDRAALEEMGNTVVLQKPVIPAVLGSWLYAACKRGRRSRRGEAAADQAIFTP